MSGVSRLAIVALLVAGFGGIAQAQSHSHRTPTSPDRYYALSEGHTGATGRVVADPGVVPSSESQTVMGLRVPR